MKSTILLLIVFLTVLGSAAYAQYPYNETISPYPKQVKERTLRQRFVCDAKTNANWKALHDTLLTPLNDSLKVESNGADPYIMLPKVEKPRTGTFEFRIRMKNNMSPGAEIFWTTTKQGTCAENAVRFRFVPVDEWYTYTKEFTTTDPLTGLRLDPGNSPGIAEIEWVELYDVVYENESPKRPDWIDPYWTAIVANWKTIASDNIKIKFDDKGTGAVVFVDDKAVGEIYPLAYIDQRLPIGGDKGVPFYREEKGSTGKKIRTDFLDGFQCFGIDDFPHSPVDCRNVEIRVEKRRAPFRTEIVRKRFRPGVPTVR